MLLSILSCEPKNETLKNKEVLPFYNTADFDAIWIDENDKNYKNIHTISDFSLLDQNGDTITKKSLDGHIYVVNFFFTSCPSICPQMTSNLKILQKEFSKNDQVKLVSFTVMPWVDSVKRLNQYAKVNNIESRKWYLLTGDKEQIYSLARNSYFAEKGLGLQKTTDEFLHTETMLLIDKMGRIRGIYNATQKLDNERVAEDISVLLKE